MGQGFSERLRRLRREAARGPAVPRESGGGVRESLARRAGRLPGSDDPTSPDLVERDVGLPRDLDVHPGPAGEVHARVALDRP